LHLTAARLRFGTNLHEHEGAAAGDRPRYRLRLGIDAEPLSLVGADGSAVAGAHDAFSAD